MSEFVFSNIDPEQTAKYFFICNKFFETAALAGCRRVVLPPVCPPDTLKTAFFQGLKEAGTENDRVCAGTFVTEGESDEKKESYVLAAGMRKDYGPTEVAELASIGATLLDDLGITGYTMKAVSAGRGDENDRFEALIGALGVDVTIEHPERKTVKTDFGFSFSAAGVDDIITGTEAYYVWAEGENAKHTVYCLFTANPERILAAMTAAECEFPEPEKIMICLAPEGPNAELRCLSLCRELRAEGFSAVFGSSKKNPLEQMSAARESGCRYYLAVPDDAADGDDAAMLDLVEGGTVPITLFGGVLETLYDMSISRTLAGLDETLEGFEGLAGLESLGLFSDDD